jgi:lysophospholipase L1-like esterase
VKRLRQLLLFGIALVFAGAVVEGALRATGFQYSPVQIGANVKDDWRAQHAFRDRNLIYDPELIWRPLSGPFSPFNPQGFRGAPIDVAKPPGSLRIFALGDSNTFGWDVDEGVNWPAQLQQLFSASTTHAEVVNAGVWGYTSYQGMRRFRELVEFRPDIVLVSFGANDAHQVTVADADYVRRHDRIDYLTRATRRLRLAQLLVQTWDTAVAAGTTSGALRPRVSLDAFESHIREIIHMGREHGIRVVLLTRPFIGSSDDHASWKAHAPAYNAATLEIGRAEQVAVIDVHGAFRDRPELFDDESHFGVDGHRLAAQLIHGELMKLLHSQPK